jgi:hypothetical protein
MNTMNLAFNLTVAYTTIIEAVDDLTTRVRLGTIAAALVAMTPLAVLAQTPTPGAPDSIVATVPTTRLLAIGSLTAKATPALVKSVLREEVPATLRLYLAGKIDQWYFTPADNGVVFILNLTDTNEAHALLDKLPLGQAGLMEFKIVPLAPLSPLGMLLSAPPR